jgi:hypothetical protein
MPYFLYHLSGDGRLHADKIACARITLTDASGDVVSARLVWGDPAWRAVNVSPMEAKGFPAGKHSAAEEFFAEDVEGFRSGRARRSRPSGSRGLRGVRVRGVRRAVEYCFQAVVRGAGGSRVQWRNREGGGNWSVVL